LSAFAVAFVVIEGVSSTALFFYEGSLLPSHIFPSSYVTKYDELLGWMYTPNSTVEGVFGPGTRVTINSQSFRAESDYALDVPAGKIRVLCSGDSFAFGSEVTDQATWCYQLMRIDPRLETINLGVGGYGVDQSYLRYKRDGRPFQHDVHLFTFITEDFRRMRNEQFGFYGKPTLHLEEGVLTVKNVPVFRQSYLVRFLTNLSNQSGRLRSIELGKGVLRRIWNPSTQQGVMSDDEVRSLAVRVIEELQRLNREKQSVLVLVYLPIATDYYNTSSDTWRRHFSSAARERGIPFLDLVENFRSLPPEKVEHFYIRPWDGHLSPTGNQYVAKLIYDRFLGIPQIAKKFPKKTFARGSVH
jgi:hypothetical protein